MHIVRKGGQYARGQQRLYEVKAIIYALAGTILLFTSIWVLGLVLLGFASHYFRRYRNWGKGILGEEMVVETLTPLDNSYVLINDVLLPEGKGNIDHILVGPTGIFVIETKNYRRPYPKRFPIRQVIRNAVSLRYFLKEQIQLDIFVHALLVFADLNATMSQSSPLVHVRNLENLCEFIKDHRTRSALDRNMIRGLVYEIQRVSRLNEKEVNIKKWLLKPALSVGLILMAYASWGLSGGNPYGEWVLVTRIIDGDTIHVGRGWRDITVSLLGVDTPETVHPDKPVEFFGHEASEFTKRSLEGIKVRLKFEPSIRHDNYGRLLAYVFLLDGTLFNSELVKEGYARVIAPSRFRYYEEFRSYEQEAMAASLGIWSGKTKTLQAPSEVSGKVVGNKGSKIYHLPGQASYGQIKEENRVYFDTEEEAVRAGYRKAKR
ncbi:MAG: thermonuclease family protein [Deltaproteobacteria bacterium]|nr:thermonuclease family protein [Deltaproteobacteria bacterium]